MANRRLEWSRQALRQVNKVILYIAEDSIQNAEKVHAEILDSIDGLIPTSREPQGY
jgi:plasmid stabilization system protein ParE